MNELTNCELDAEADVLVLTLPFAEPLAVPAEPPSGIVVDIIDLNLILTIFIQILDYPIFLFLI